MVVRPFRPSAAPTAPLLSAALLLGAAVAVAAPLTVATPDLLPPEPRAQAPVAAAPHEPGAAAAEGDIGGPTSPAERLRITVLGGNPIFALDWLSRGLDPPTVGRAPPRPRVLP